MALTYKRSTVVIPSQSAADMNMTKTLEFGPIKRQSSTGILAFPPEILSAIFEQGKEMVDTESLNGEGNVHPSKSFEWLVSQTCPAFRDIALATPTLWTSLLINGTCPLSWIHECIKRSGSCLLDLLIDDGQRSEDGKEYWLDDATIHAITSHSVRWRSISLTCSYERIVSRICNCTAPSLRYLSLQVTRMKSPDFSVVNEMKSPLIFKSGTPVLNFLRLGDWAMCSFRPPLQSIVTLHFDIMGRKTILYPTFRGIITGCPILEHLSINGDIIGRNIWPRRSDVIALPRLRSLRICGIDGGVYSGILLGFDAPQLQSLTLKDMHDEDLDELWDLDDKSRYLNLTHLVFQDFELSSTAYRCVFNTFAEVTSFSAPYYSFMIDKSPLIQFLTFGIMVGQDPPSFPWPKLRDVEFNFKNEVDEDVIINNMAQNLGIQGRPLSAIKLRVSEEEVDQLVGVHVQAPTVCSFVTEDELWPLNRSFMDYHDPERV